MRDGSRKALTWGLVVGYSVASAFLLVLALNGAFYYAPFGSGAQLSILRRAPCAAVARYADYVLENKKGLFRGPSEKMGILELLVEAEDRGARLCYDPRLAIPYLGKEAARRYAMDENEPFGPLAENLILKRRDSALIKAAFDKYRLTEPQVTFNLCWRLEEQYPQTLEYVGFRQIYCPPPERPDSTSILSPEERRKEAFDRILDESRRGAR
jgi:hypothetical protein